MGLLNDPKQRADHLFQQGLEKYKQERFQTVAEELLQLSQNGRDEGIRHRAQGIGRDGCEVGNRQDEN